jgi:hypothetical protein
VLLHELGDLGHREEREERQHLLTSASSVLIQCWRNS